MQAKGNLKILFIINPFSGNQSIDWFQVIADYFQDLHYVVEIYVLENGFKVEGIKKKIAISKPDKVVAVGGDGTFSLVAECILQKNIPLGILPAGSANGLAKELGISEIPHIALQTILSETLKKIHVTLMNDNLCIHLGDIGFNAKMIKQFQAENIRGFWGYFKANLNVAWSTLFINPKFKVQMTIGDQMIERKAVTIVLANATKYGSGAVINPTGSLEDDVFEIIVIKKISVMEVFKMMISHEEFNPQKTEIFSAQSLKLILSRKIHFQVDGEYLGKVDHLEAYLIPAALSIIVPDLNNR
jgi:diacylglycerol kinase (ATP)